MANNRELLITLGADTTKFTQKVKRAKDLTKELDSQFKLLSSSSKDFEQSTQGLAQKQQYLGNKLKVASEHAKAHIQRLKESQEELTQATAKHKEYSEELENLQKKYKDLKETDAGYEAAQKEIEGVQQKLSSATTEVRRHTDRILDSRKSYNLIQAEMQGTQKEISEITEKMKLMEKSASLDAMKNDIKETAHTFDLISKSTKDFGNNMETLEMTQSHYNDMLKQNENLLNAYDNDMKESAKTITQYKGKISELEKEMERYQRMMSLYDESDDRFAVNAEKVEDLRLQITSANAVIKLHEERIKSVGTEYKSTEKEIANFTNKINTTGDKMKSMIDKISFEKVESEIEKLSKDTLARLERELSDLDHEFDLVKNSCEGFGNTVKGLETQQEHLNNAIKLSKATLAEYNTSLIESKKRVNDLVTKKQSLEKEMEKAMELKLTVSGKDFDKLTEDFEANKKELQEVTKELEEWTNTMNASAQGVKKTQSSLVTMNRELKESKSNLNNLKTKDVFDGLEREIKVVNNQLKVLDAKLNLARSKFINFDTSITAVSTKKKLLNQQIKATNDLLSKYDKSIDETKNHLKKLEEQQEKVKQRTLEVQAALEKAHPKTEEYQKLNKELIELESDLQKVNAAIEEHTDSLADMHSESINAQASVNNLTKELNTTLGNALKNVGEGVKNFGQSIENLGQAMLPVTTAITAFGAIGIKTGMDFTKAMSEVGAVAEATGEDLEKLTDTARLYGEKTTYSAVQSSEALKYLALAGYDTNQAISTLPMILQTAQAGAMDLATASDLATDSISSLGYVGNDAVKEMPDYLNRVAAASTNANTSIQQMMEAYIRVGGQLDTMKISTTESATMLGVLANRGIKAEQAGVSLNSILINMTKKTGDSAKGMSKLGVSMFDATGNIRNIEDVMKDMSLALSKLKSDEERVNVINLIGGKTQAKTLQKLLQGMVDDTGDLSDEYKALKAEIEDGVDTNALEKMSKAMTDNLSGDWDILKSSIQESFLTLFTAVEPVLREVTQNATKFVQALTAKFKSMDENTQKIIFKFGVLAAAIGPVLIVVGKTVSMFGSMIMGLGNLSKGLGIAKTALSAFSATGGGLKAVFQSLKTQMLATTTSGSALSTIFTALNTKALLMAGGFGAAAAALIALWVEGQKSSIEGSKAITEGVDSTTRTMVESYVDATKSIDAAFLRLKSSTVAVTASMINDVNSNITTLATQTTDMLTEGSEKAEKILKKNFELSQSFSEKEQNQVINAVQKAYEEKIKVVETSQKTINDIMKKAEKEKRDVNNQELIQIEQHQNKIKDIALLAMNQYSSEMTTIKQRLVEKEGELNAESIVETLKTAKQKKEDTIEQANQQYNELNNIYDLIGDSLDSKSKQLLRNAVEDAKSRKDQTTTIAEQEYAALVETARKAAGEYVDNIDWATGEIKNKWQVMWDGMSNGVQGFISKFSSRTYAVSNWIEIFGKKAEIAWLKVQKLWSGKQKDAELDTRIKSIEKEIDSLDKLGESLDKTMTRYQNLSDDLATIGSGIDGTVFSKLGVNIVQLANNVDGSLDKITKDFDSLPVEVQNSLNEYNQKLIDAGVSGGLNQFLSYLKGDMEHVRMEFKDMSSNAQETAKALTSAFERAEKDLDGLTFENYVQMTKTNIEEAQKILEKLPAGVQHTINNMPQEEWSQILAYYTTTTEKMGTDVGNAIDTKGKENAEKQYEQAKKIGESAAKGVEDSTTEVEQAVNNLNTTTEKSLNTSSDAAYQKGSETTSNVASGMSSNIGEVQGAVSEIQGALDKIDGIRLGNVTKQLSEINKWLGTVSKASGTTRTNLDKIPKISYGSTTKGLSEVNKWLNTVDSTAKTKTTPSLKAIVVVTYGSTTKGLSEVNKWLGNVKVSADSAKLALMGLKGVTYGSVTKGLSQVASWLDTIKNKASGARSAVANVSTSVANAPRTISYVQDEIADMAAYARTSMFDMSDINLSNYKTSGGYYEPTIIKGSATESSSKEDSVLRTLLQSTLEQNQILIQLLGNQAPVEVALNMDGRQIAKASARYINNEINAITKRNNRLGGII